MRISDWSSDVCSSDLLSFGQVVAQVLAQRGLVGAVVEHVVGDLEGVAQREAVVVQPCLHRRIGAGQQRAQPGGRGEQHRGLAFDHAQVGGFVQIGRASCRERVCQYVYISVVAGSFQKQKTKAVQSK